MGSLVRLCCFLFIVWNKSTASLLVISDINTSDVIVATPSHKDDIRIIYINPKAISNEVVTDFETRLSKIEGQLKKLFGVRRDRERSSASENSTQPPTTTKKLFPVVKNKVDFTRDIVQHIKSEEFEKAENKLIAMGDDAEISTIVHEAYGALETNFGSVLDFGKGLSNTTTSYKVFKSLANEVHVNGQQDPFKLIALATALRGKVLIQHLDPNAIKADAAAIIKGLDHNITTSSTKYLADAMNTSEYQTSAKVHFLAEAIDDYDTKLSVDIMRDLVDEAYGKFNASHILANIVSHSKLHQAVGGIVALFRKIENSGQLNNNTVLDLAFHLSKLQKRIDYVKLTPAALRGVDFVLKNLPTCARSLFFERSVCLWNKEQRAYLYVADSTANYDKDRRRIFVSPEFYRVSYGTPWLVEKVGDHILFKSARYVNEYLYAAEIEYSPGTHYVFTWIPGKNTDAQSEWKIELDGDFCSVKSAHFSEQLYASPETYVFTHKSYVLAEDSKILWQIRGC